jgi:hypothetical protein
LDQQRAPTYFAGNKGDTATFRGTASIVFENVCCVYADMDTKDVNSTLQPTQSSEGNG